MLFQLLMRLNAFSPSFVRMWGGHANLFSSQFVHNLSIACLHSVAKIGTVRSNSENIGKTMNIQGVNND